MKSVVCVCVVCVCVGVCCVCGERESVCVCVCCERCVCVCVCVCVRGVCVWCVCVCVCVTRVCLHHTVKIYRTFFLVRLLKQVQTTFNISLLWYTVIGDTIVIFMGIEIRITYRNQIKLRCR